jgi:membrane-bound lytic murein transglycosylase MltF
MTLRIPHARIASSALILALATIPRAGSPAGAQTAPATPRGLQIANKPWQGDLDQLLERRMLRVLVPYSRTLYYNDNGQERGLTAELVRDFERWLNQKHKARLGKRPLTVYLIPTTRDRLISGVEEGLGDIAAGNLTATDERRAVVDFVLQDPERTVAEVVVTGPRSPALATLDELSGRTVHARPSSSYHASLERLNAGFEARKREPMRIVDLPEALEDEDALEMLGAGLLEILVVDDWKAVIWAQAVPAIRVRADLEVATGGRIGWAIRKQSPGLAAEIADFYRNFAHKQGVIEYRRQREAKRIRAFRNNAEGSEWKRFEATLELFRRYGARYGFDPLMLAAQGYQESRLDQDAKSHVGAIGIMQIMPATGAELAVGDIAVAEHNVHAGAKYMHQLMSRYFKDANFSEGNRPLFAFASYNAGPGNISKMRKEAGRRGLDPDRWFNNVEVVVAERIGIETTTYVRNIYKYYVSYKLGLEATEAARKAREQAAAPAG